MCLSLCNRETAVVKHFTFALWPQEDDADDADDADADEASSNGGSSCLCNLRVRHVKLSKANFLGASSWKIYCTVSYCAFFEASMMWHFDVADGQQPVEPTYSFAVYDVSYAYTLQVP